MSRARTQRAPSLAVSALAHAAVIAAALIVWPMLNKPLPLGKVVPVTLVTSEPPAEQAAAVQAPVPTPAATSAAPKPAEKTKPTPSKQAPSIKPAPAASAQAANKKDLDLDALMASIDNQRQSPAAKAASGQIGPSRPRAEKTASEGHGQDSHMSGSELGALKAKLKPLWTPNCEVEAGKGIIVRVHVHLTPQGWLAGQPELVDKGKIEASGNPLLIAAATRALSALGRGQPYSDVLTSEHYPDWRDMILTFDPKEQCGG